MDTDFFKKIVKKHSTTFYYATLFFPEKIKNDVFILYSYLRTADDLVDESDDLVKFIYFKSQTNQSLQGKHHQDPIVSAFVKVFKKYHFSKSYLDSFFKAQESDFSSPFQISSQKQLDTYVYGVAGVVGEMMAKILNLPEKLIAPSIRFGELMQYVNILRDIKPDFEMGRIYLPKTKIKYHDLAKAIVGDPAYTRSVLDKISLFANQILKDFADLSADINQIPQPYRRAIKISQGIYLSITRKIYSQPHLVLKQRVYVPKSELGLIILKNIF